MSKLTVLTHAEVSADNQAIFDQLKSALGMVPNLYATYANSPVALKAILNLGDTLKGGSFTNREIEAIALAVSETNNCEYCLAAHTTIAKMNGFTEDETLELRGATSGDEKLQALAALSRSISINRGRPDDALVDAFFAAGYSKAALVELIGFVAVNTYNNYLNNLSNTPVDFPSAKVLETA